MRRITCILVIVSAIAAAGCASNPRDSTSTVSPSSSGGEAVLHRYPEQGFSIAFGSSWQAHTQPEGSDWHLDVTPVDDQEVTPAVGVTVMASSVDVDPLAFQRHPPAKYQRILDGIAQNTGTEPAFVPVEVNGVPAIMASYYDGSTYNHEWYLLGDGHHVYSLGIAGSRETWEAEAPDLRAIVQSFTLQDDGR